MEEENLKDSTLRDREIFTMKEWCDKNGYDGVTKECLISASEQDDPKLKSMAKEHLSKGIINKVKEKDNDIYARKRFNSRNR
ncbi:MAG: hypothetical protein Tp1124DCM412261_29 [Prokaryotic dsDNA virus sp.]|nr:MAG: hypothetical protein Tp1123DCM939791_5 [Prokaryotic dsDNA virus sp.]QDP59861.1 MAG: hypothetical protein Tp1124DCM412261_29 [Prokaryotic dsDNA virus sp.]